MRPGSRHSEMDFEGQGSMTGCADPSPRDSVSRCAANIPPYMAPNSLPPLETITIISSIDEQDKDGPSQHPSGSLSPFGNNHNKGDRDVQEGGKDIEAASNATTTPPQPSSCIAQTASIILLKAKELFSSTTGRKLQPNAINTSVPPAILSSDDDCQKYSYFSSTCAKSLLKVLVGYGAALTATAFFAHVEVHLSLVILSLLPAFTTMMYMRRLFHRSVLRSEMVVSFFITMIYMSPVVILENLWYLAALTKSNLDKEGAALHSTEGITWGYKLLASFVRAYAVAALFEEAAKYLAILRLGKLPYVRDPRAVVTYAMCIGACFGVVETLFLYAFVYGVENTVARAMLSIPLHCMTSLIMGCAVAENTFGSKGSQPWYKVLPLPILLHGTFDLSNFVLSDEFSVCSLFVASLIIVTGFAYVRYWLVSLMQRMPVEDDIRAAIIEAAKVEQEEKAAAKVVQEGEEEEEEEEGEQCSRSLRGPSKKSIILVVCLGCCFTTGMLCFLRLW